MNQTLKRLQARLRVQHGFGKIWTLITFIAMVAVFAVHRSFALLFQSPMKSFELLHDQDGNGVWTGSYMEHQRFQKQVRLFSASGFAIVVLATVVSFSAAQLLFPGGVDKVQAAAPFIITNGNDSGPGSLRQVVTECNADPDPDGCLIEINGNYSITLSSRIEFTNKAVFQNNTSETALIIDGSGVSGEPCMYFNAGSEGSWLKGMELRDCGGAVEVSADNISIGGGGDVASRVYFAGGNRQVNISASISDTNISGFTLDNAVVGQRSDGTPDPIAGGVVYTNNVNVSDMVIRFVTVYSAHTSPGPGVFVMGDSDNTVSGLTIQDVEIQNSGSYTNGITLRNATDVDIFHAILTETSALCSISLESTSNVIIRTGTFHSNVCILDGSSNVRVGAAAVGPDMSDSNTFVSSNIKFQAAVTGTNQFLYNTWTGTSEDNTPFEVSIPGSPAVVNLGGLDETNDAESSISGDTPGGTGVLVIFKNDQRVYTQSVSGTSFSLTNTDIGGSPITTGDTLFGYVIASSGMPSIGTTATVIAGTSDTNNNNGENNNNGGGDQETLPDITVTATTARFEYDSSPVAVQTSIYVSTNLADFEGNPPPIMLNPPAAADASPVTAHDLTVTGLTPETTYYYAIIASIEGDVVVVNQGTFSTTSLTASGVTPDIQVTETTATAVFTSSQSIKSRFYVSENEGDVLGQTPVQEDAFGTSHSIIKTGLTTNTTYYYTITADVEGGSENYTVIATGSFTTDSGIIIEDLDDDFLEKNATVNQQVVYNPKTKLYLGPGSVNLTLENATKNNDIQYEVREESTDGDVVLTVDWQQITKNTIRQKFAGLQQGVVYIIQAKLRKTSQPNVEDTQKQVATIQKTDRNAPGFTTYTGNVVVTAEPVLKMGGDLAGKEGYLRLQDVHTGAIVSACHVPAGQSICELTPRPLPGDYRIQFSSVKNATPGAPFQMLLTITDKNPTTALFADRNNPYFKKRIVQVDKLTIAGSSEKELNIEIYLDGKKVHTIKRGNKAKAYWEYELDLYGQARGEHIVRVLERKRDGSGKFVDRIDIPFYYSRPVSLVTVDGLRNSYVRNTGAPVTIIGDANNITSVYIDGAFITNVTLEPTTGGKGAGALNLPTTDLGTRELSLQTRNQVGLRGALQTFDYLVYVPSTNGNGNTNSSNTNNENTNNSNENVNNSNENTNNSNTNTGNENTNNSNENTNNSNENTNNANTSNGNGNENTNNSNENVNNSNENTNNSNTNTGNENTNNSNTNAPVVNTPAELDSPVPFNELPKPAQDLVRDNLNDAAVIIIDDSVVNVADIPLEYKTAITDPTRRQEILSELEALLKEKYAVRPVREIEDQASGTFHVEPVITDNDQSQSVFPREKTIGLPTIGKQVLTKYGLEVTGTALPYSLVKATLHSTAIVKLTRANSDGQWSMIVPSDALEQGPHNAFLQTESRSVASTDTEIANFVVVDKQKISNTTWIVIINLALAGVILILVLGMQLGKHRKDNDEFDGDGTGVQGGKDFLSGALPPLRETTPQSSAQAGPGVTNVPEPPRGALSV